MVREHKLILDIKEFDGVVFHCGICKQDVVYKLHAGTKLHRNCPFCNEEWIDKFPNRSSKPQESFEEILLDVLRHFYNTKNSSPVDIKLMINEDEEEGSGGKDKTKKA